MEPMTVFTIIELAYKGYNWGDSLTPQIDKAYAKALKKWAPNKGVRSFFANKQLSTMQELSKYILDRNSINEGIRLLLEYFEEELKQDSCTYLKIIEILGLGSLAIIKSTKNSVNEINQKIDDVSMAISSQTERTHTLLYTIIEQLDAKQKTTIQSAIYNDVDGYIQRTARVYQTYDISIYLEKNKFTPKPLSQYVIEGERLIVLYSDAQLGKSTELRRLAFELYDSNLYNPFLFNLCKYNGKLRLEELVKISDRFNTVKIDVLILDGLDEVADDNREELITEIEYITENYPDLYIIVSCRSNFEATNGISGFKKLYLNQLSWDDIEVYIKERCNRPDALIHEIQEKKYYEVAFSPFYLNESIKYFQEKGELPANKTIFYEEFINRCFYIDNNRKPNKGKIVSLKTRLYPVLIRIAFCMLSSQRQEISLDELSSELSITEDIIQQCLSTSLLYNDKSNNIKFIHNSFKEYIVAKYLSQLSFNQVQSVICYNGTTRIKPTMYNTSVLLLGVIDKSDELFSSLMLWLINDYKELLVRCGFEVLDEGERNQIFIDVFNDYKEKHLRIEYDFSNSLIHFGNTKESLLFLLEEIRREETYSTNMINALNMLKYAKFELLQAEEFKQAKQLLLSVLHKYQDDVEYGSYLCRPFENACFLTSQIISDFFEAINETVNCNIINYLCTLVCKIDQCDSYADWIFSKMQYVHDYRDESGVRYTVSKNYIIRFLGNLKKPNNIVKAISCYEDFQENSYSWSNEELLYTSLFDNLIKYTEKSSLIIDEVILSIGAIEEQKLTSSYCHGYYLFFSERANPDEIFEKHYLIVTRLLKELSQEKDEVKWIEFYKSLKIVVVLLDNDRLMNILNDDTADEQIIHWLCNIVKSYQAISGEFITKINSRFEHLNRGQIDWGKRKQEAFNILFKRELFIIEVQKIIAGKQRILADIDSRRELFSMDTNDSVIQFIWWCKEPKKKHVETLVVEEKLKDYVEYICFIINQLPIPSHSVNYEKIAISNTQKDKLKEIVIFALTNPNKFSHLESFINIIVEYNLLIPDALLLTLFPYSHMYINYVRKNRVSSKFHSSGTFLDYLEDSISDLQLLDQHIEEWITSEKHNQYRFYQSITEHIVSYRKKPLYKYFKQLLNKSVEYSYRLNIAICITELGREGIQIVNCMLDDLNESEKIYYYEHILFPEDKSNVVNKERVNICEIIETNYPTYDDSLKEKALRILLNLGSSKALDWGLEYIRSHEEWVYKDHFPSLHKYNSDYIEGLSAYFDIATSITIPKFSMHTVIDSVIYVLKVVANESEEMRDKVVDMFKQKANIEGLFYLHRIADETFDKYFETNYGTITLQQASILYDSILNS